MTALTRHLAGDTTYQGFVAESLSARQLMEHRRLAFAVAPACHWCSGPCGPGWTAEYTGHAFEACCPTCKHKEI